MTPPAEIRVRRIGHHPIVHQGLSKRLGNNINGPSLLRRPTWATGPGRFMLYFAHHYGKHIRLAFADRLEGPWVLHEEGVLSLEKTPFAKRHLPFPQPDWAIELGIDAFIPHVASPDVHLNHTDRRFEMLFHGLADDGEQKSYQAASANGLDWSIVGPPISQTYLRRFNLRGEFYAIGLGGQLLRGGSDGGYELGPWPLPAKTRHVAVLPRDPLLHVLFSRYDDAPERLFHTVLGLEGDWNTWKILGEPIEVLRPELEWEGAYLPITPGIPGATDFTHALRDPALFEDGGKLWLVYAGGGESALGLAEIDGL